MKLIHLADLHLGKRVNGFSMLEDQAYILDQILQIADTEQTDAVLIAGDVYDKSVPSEEAVRLFDSFLARLQEKEQTVFVIAGNHDSAERLAFGGRILGKSGVHISPVYAGVTEPVCLQDPYGTVAFWLLPFLKPIHVRKSCPDADPKTYDEAVQLALQQLDTERFDRNVLLTHQFVMGGQLCDSEDHVVGGTDAVGAAAFESFDYVALGHLHGPQQVGKPTVRYAGSPLKYSFSECSHKKSAAIVELGNKGNVEIRLMPLKPLRDLAELRGDYDTLTLRSFYESCGHRDDYVRITLTDEEDIPNAAARLRVIYPWLMKLDYDNCRTRASMEVEELDRVEQCSPMDVFCRFYQQQNQTELTQEQLRYLSGVLENIWEETP